MATESDNVTEDEMLRHGLLRHTLASWRFIDADTPLNLVLQINKETLEMVIQDASPRANSFTAPFPND